ncbi:N-acetylmuramoyl-L-alanine amidase [Kineococcus arenarius]|uniref:N-acetylmuramoyl-L-alanine amidase n=1 Tax=unclassified Kineococcus TaxID=2621656 RepID=UPI003D7CA862
MRWTASAQETGNRPGTDGALSRRALLRAGGGAGALSALVCLTGTTARPAAAAPGTALSSGTPAVGGSTTSYPLAQHPGTAATAAVPAPRGATTRSLHAGAALSVVRVEVAGGRMVGVTFPRGTAAESVAVRTRNGEGAWSAWSELPLNDNEADPGTSEADGRVTGSDPLWVGSQGDLTTVEVRLPAADVAHAELHVVDPGHSAADELAATSASTVPADTSGVLLRSTGEQPVDERVALAAPTIRTRAAWGADETLRKSSASYSGTLKAAVVHHTADPGSYTQAQVPAVIRGMYRYHTVTLGWADLGYNFVVDRFGGIWEGRAGGTTRPVVGAHAGGFNVDTFGVSMMGDYTSVAPSAACLESIAQVIAWKFSLHGIDPAGTTRLTSAGGGTARYAKGTTVTLRTVSAHRDVGYTACPGNVGFTKMDTIRTRVAQLTAGGGSTASEVAAKYAAVGAGVLGSPTSDEGPAKIGGRYRHYATGSIYFLPATGAHFVKGLIRDKWKAMGWEGSYLGFPTTDEITLPGGAFNHFQGGSIYWSPRTGAHAVRGLIRDKWASLGWETGFLGYPTTDENPLPGGAFTHFAGGSVYFSPRAGTHVVRGAIRDAWARQGWETGRLGYPTSDEYDVAGGKRSDFQGGSITWTPARGAVVTHR